MRVLVPLAPPMSKFGTVSPSYGCRPFCSSPYLYQECVDELLHLVERIEVDVLDLVQVAVDDRAARHHQVVRAVVVGLDFGRSPYDIRYFDDRPPPIAAQSL